MDYKKTNAPTNTVTRNLMELCEDTGNIYETLSQSVATRYLLRLSKT